MASTLQTEETGVGEKVSSTGKAGLLAGGGVLGAVAAASCCIVPLALTLAGVSGAWMANLRALAPYQPYFTAITLVFIGLGFYHVYWKPRRACAADGACAKPLPDRLVKTGLWTGTILVLAAFSFPYWFAAIEPYLP